MQTKVINVDPKTLKLLEVNARFMRHEEFQRLVANIKRDGQLTSAPFAAITKDGTYEVLSGNHRVQAAVAAGLESIPCIITDDELSKEQRIAIQLSHNALVGQDDVDTLKKLYDEIIDIDLKEYSGLDDKTLELLDKVSSQAMTEANLEYQVMSIVYLPDELKEAQRIIDEALGAVKNNVMVWLVRDNEYDRWLDAQEITSAAYNVKNVASAINLVLQVFEKNMHQLAEAWEDDIDDKRWVPIESVIGRSKIPAGSAKVIRKAIDTMLSRQEVTSKNMWQALEYMAAEYLSGE